MMYLFNFAFLDTRKLFINIYLYNLETFDSKRKKEREMRKKEKKRITNGLIFLVP